MTRAWRSNDGRSTTASRPWPQAGFLAAALERLWPFKSLPFALAPFDFVSS